MSDLDAFKAKFRIEELTVLKFDHWTWSIRPVQSTLGASILSLNSPAARWSDASSEAMTELHNVLSKLEGILHRQFQYDRLNYLMLMMVDYHVHFHVLPRYQSPRFFAGNEWLDRTWPKPPDIGGEVASDKMLLAIRTSVRPD
jgi:diadenosine tetraphosphate (Ap4A) HIT family hydrolase